MLKLREFLFSFWLTAIMSTHLWKNPFTAELNKVEAVWWAHLFWQVQAIWCRHTVRSIGSPMFPEAHVSICERYQSQTLESFLYVWKCTCVTAFLWILFGFVTTCSIRYVYLYFFFYEEGFKFGDACIFQCCQVSMWCEANMFFWLCLWFVFIFTQCEKQSWLYVQSTFFQTWKT